MPEAKLLWLPGQLKQLALHARPGRRLSWKGSSRTPGRPHPAHPAALEDGAPVFPPRRRAWSSAEQMRRSLHTVQFSETAGFSQDCASKSKLNLFCFHLKNLKKKTYNGICIFFLCQSPSLQMPTDSWHPSQNVSPLEDTHWLTTTRIHSRIFFFSLLVKCNDHRQRNVHKNM